MYYTCAVLFNTLHNHTPLHCLPRVIQLYAKAYLGRLVDPLSTLEERPKVFLFWIIRRTSNAPFLSSLSHAS